MPRFDDAFRHAPRATVSLPRQGRPMEDTSRCLAVLALAALTPIGAAQVDWRQRDILAATGSVACDVLRGQLLLQTDSLTAGQTWFWNGVDWRRALPSSVPPPVGGQSLAFDSGRGVVV